jgi:molybdopterin/thiamine biosynthesis adenylyltransferase
MGQGQIQFFGVKGQRRIRQAHLVVLGCGGLGLPVIQQMAYLGVRRWTRLYRSSY